MIFEYNVVYEYDSDKFDIEHYLIKVKVTVRVQNVVPFSAMQTVRKLRFSSIVHLTFINKLF